MKKKLFSVCVCVYIGSCLKESVETRLVFLLHSDLQWMHCNHFLFAKQFLCGSAPVHSRKKPIMFWATRSHIRKRCDCLVSCPYEANVGVMGTCQATCCCSLFVDACSFDQHMLYWPWSFVAKAVHCLCWNIGLVKWSILEKFPACKCAGSQSLNIWKGWAMFIFYLASTSSNLLS